MSYPAPTPQLQSAVLPPLRSRSRLRLRLLRLCPMDASGPSGAAALRGACARFREEALLGPPGAPLRISLLAALLGCLALGAHPRAAAATPPPASVLQTLASDPSPTTRLTVLRSLQAAGQLDSKQLIRCLADTAPAVRAEVVRLAPDFLTGDEELQRKILALANDKSSEVRLALLEHLNRFSPAGTEKALARILALQARSAPDWTAGVQHLRQELPDALRILLGTPHLHPSSVESAGLFRRLGSHLASQPGGLSTAIELLGSRPRVPVWQQTALLEGLGTPVSGYAAPKEKPAVLDALTRSGEREVAALASKLKKQLERLGRADSKP